VRLRGATSTTGDLQMTNSAKSALYAKASAKAFFIYLDLKDKDSDRAEAHRKIASRYIKLAVQLGEANV
jgi:hypothetical protein